MTLARPECTAAPRSTANSSVSMNDSRAADAMTTSTSTDTTGLYTPPVSAMSASVNTESKPVTSHE